VGAELFHADGQTDEWKDTTKLIVAFRKFAKVPKIPALCPHSVFMFFMYLKTNSDYFLLQH
jgi:hypothetical protein